MSSRFESSNIQLGNSFVLDTSNENLEKEKLNKAKEDAIIKTAQKQADEIINNARTEAEKAIEETKKQIEEMIQQAQAFIEQKQEEGYQAGYQSGYDDGYNKTHEDLINQVKNLDLIAQSAFNVKREIIASSEHEILQLTTVIAEKILRQQFELKPELILNIIKAAINELKDKEEIRIIVNPAVTQCLYEFSEELKQTIRGLSSIKILEDKTIRVDAVIVESAEFTIDAGLEAQIQEITRKLMQELAEDPVLGELPKEIEIKIEEPRDLDEDD